MTPISSKEYRTPKLKESQIHRAVVDYWRKAGRRDTLLATIPNMNPHGQAGLTPGLADLIVIGGGKVRFLELKTETGKLTRSQEAIKAICEANGVEYAVTYGREEPIAVLKEWGIVG